MPGRGPDGSPPLARPPCAGRGEASRPAPARPGGSACYPAGVRAGRSPSTAREGPCPTRYLPLDGFDAGPSAVALLHGARLLVADDRRLACARLDGAREWEVARTPPAFPRSRAPRAIRAGGRPLWVGGDVVVQLLDAEDGVALVAHDVPSGRERWRRTIPTPPPASFAEVAPAWDGAQTEELTGFLGAGDVLALAIARTSRRTTRWPDHPAPELRAQLDLARLDPSDGRALWESSFPDVRVPLLEQRRFSGWHVAGRRLAVVDWATGAARAFAELDGEPGWPRRVGRHVLVPLRRRGAIAVERFDARTGARKGRAEWRRNGVRELRIHDAGGAAALQVNDQLVSPLGDDLAPRWELRAQPYVYGVAAAPSGPVVVATSGNGGGVYAVARASGEVLREVRIPGGAWDAVRVDGTALVAAACWGGRLAIVDRRGRIAQVAVPGAHAVAGARAGRVVVLSRAPRPGVQIVDVRRAFR